MNPWHRFWFPDDPDDALAHRDAALWTPQALMQTQREFWRQATQATEDWWRYLYSVWPHLAALPPAGVVTPPAPEDDGARASETNARTSDKAGDATVSPKARRPRRPPRPSARHR